ncbi:MAG TPA: bifunctional precorrin-2 dehydrogenase/sirohydrochlorin ferrochelatase, partial [Chloroflexota bacterium]|nr:bifunctional precorrin-2 dehydrogenase/sirohydrochlorin ferrochelatase [Chloroflexota bacterium]
LYPVGLQLTGKRCLVVGAGAVAERRIAGLLAAGALVHVIAPDATPAIRDMARDGRLGWSARDAVPDDLTGCLIAVICSSDRAANRLLAAEAERRGVLANVADAPEEGSIVSPALLECDDVLVAIWSGGGGPVVSQLVRDHVAGCLGEEWGALSRVVARCRAEINRGMPANRRAGFWRGAIDATVLALLRQGDEAGAEEMLREMGRTGQGAARSAGE